MKFFRFNIVFAVFVALCSIGGSEGARILGIFPTPSISHQVVFHALVKDLAAKGHYLTVLTTDTMKIDNPNVTEIVTHDEPYEMFKALNFVDIKKSNGDGSNLISIFTPVIMKVLDLQLSHPDIKNIIEKRDNQTFDVLIVEHLYFTSVFAFAELYDCPIIGITSMDTVTEAHEAIGNEANPVIHPDIFLPFTHGKLTFGERFQSLAFYLTQKFYLSDELQKGNTNLVRKHFPTIDKTIGTMASRVQLIMVNAHPAMGFIRPILPNTIQLGFMHVVPPKPLPNGDLKTFLDTSPNGVIYMSLGSNVKSKDLSPEILQTFLNVFGNSTYNVIWKFEADELPNKPDNVFIAKWLPQSDLLAHPSIKLFITQGGQQSMEEAVDRTVPMVVIPFFGDQDSNAKRMVEKGIGYHLEFDTMTEAKLTDAINEMLKPVYKQNVENLRLLVNDQPMSAREKAVWWTEYVIRHKGAKHLEYPGRAVPFYQRYCLDFIAVGFGVTWLIFTVVRQLFSRCFSGKKPKIE